MTQLLDRQTELAHAPQRQWVLFEVNNDCIVQTVQRARQTCMSDMIDVLGIEKVG